MVPEFGLFALILAFCFSLTQSLTNIIGIRLQQAYLLRLNPALTYGQFSFVVLSFLCLVYAFISNDFSVAYVAQNSNTALPVFYRISAVWGAHEGSLLLWIVILSAWSLLVILTTRRLPEVYMARVMAVLSLISVGFMAFLIMTSNPFQRLLPNIPVNGRDLNPLLQDPGLAFHPPLLYLGYVGFAVVFAFAIAALLEASKKTQWARWARPWTLASWAFLTVGITLGSWWAYRELGWGGWWFWDPVENASLLPWLVGTALIHSLAVTEKRGLFRVWAIFLAICAFSLSLIGTFLVRSGVLVSVHAFANDPARGIFLLKFLLVVIGGSFILYAWKAPRLRYAAYFEFLSRETFLLLNNVILVVTMFMILLGTIYPLIIDALNAGKISVGAPYFNSLFSPLMTVLLLLMGVGPFLRWRSMPVAALVKKIRYVLPASVLAGVGLPWLITGSLKPSVVLGLTLSIWVLATSVQQMLQRFVARKVPLILLLRKLPWSQYAMWTAHIGVAVCTIGIVLTTAYSVEKDVRMAPGEVATVAAYQFKFDGVHEIRGDNYRAIDGTFYVTKQGSRVATIHAQKRIYDVNKQAMTDAGIDASLFRDLYVSLGEPLDNGAWAIRIYYKPFVRWIWLGGLLMLLGGLIALGDKRYRVRRKKKCQQSKLDEGFIAPDISVPEQGAVLK